MVLYHVLTLCLSLLNLYNIFELGMVQITEAASAHFDRLLEEYEDIKIPTGVPTLRQYIARWRKMTWSSSFFREFKNEKCFSRSFIFEQQFGSQKASQRMLARFINCLNILLWLHVILFLFCLLIHK